MRKKILLPFSPEFEERMLSGEKTCTTRSKRYGRSGDWFPAFGKYFVLTEVYSIPLQRAVLFCYKEEGFANSQEFIEFWNSHHVQPYESSRARPAFIHYFQPIQKAYQPLPSGVTKPK